MTPPLKSKIVFAPAGSGKTEQLSYRYLELVEAGVKPERILTLTFTDKAAVEMKERILNNARKRNPEIYNILRENILRLRISTIHSFCFSLVRRFADLLNIDPNPAALTDAKNLWRQAKYDALMKIAENNDLADYRSLLISLITREHIQGWKNFSKFLDHLFEKRTVALRAKPRGFDINSVKELAERLKREPAGFERIKNYQELFPEDLGNPGVIERIFKTIADHQSVFMTTQNTPRIRGLSERERRWAADMVRYRNLIAVLNDFNLFKQRWHLFQDCFLATYNEMKQGLGVVDYDDMELLALRLLTEESEWQNILYIFDEHTDHILVDEFQDTSFLQWGIIDKLTEEWRSGEGLKRELGVAPTIFIVGDDKQSIYMFRNARVELFFKAKEKLEQWLGSEKVETVTLQENYRSLPAIIDFTNALFSQLMNPTENKEPWRSRYRHFVCRRIGKEQGKVAIILEPRQEVLSIADKREIDAQNLARAIKALIATNFKVSDSSLDASEIVRPCRYKDIAILIRSRQGILPALEKSLRKENIPFVVVGGTGFYEESEVRYLTALVSFLVDPADDTALYITLRGPLFNIPERDIFLWMTKGETKEPTLWERLDALAREPSEGLERARKILGDALRKVNYEPLYSLVDHILLKTKAWEVFSEPQRVANIRKFIHIIQEEELAGKTPLRIKSLLEQSNKDEPKAEIPNEEMNAVQIMTVHSAKGLQFPIVFHPGLHERVLQRETYKEKLVVEENALGEVIFSYIEEGSVRRLHPLHAEYLEKVIEEEKRVFYVACTRARDALFLTGVWDTSSPEGTRLEWLINHLGLKRTDHGFEVARNLPGLSITTPQEILQIEVSGGTEEHPTSVPLIRIEPPLPSPPPQVRTVTKYTPHELQKHSDEALGIGETLHRLLELISLGKLDPFSPRLEEETARLLRIKGFSKEIAEKLDGEILRTVKGLVSSPVWEIVRPQPNSFVELPIMYHDGKTIWTGRIDRVILKPDAVHIYDYKTLRVKEEEILALKEHYYATQLIYYARACAELFPGRAVKKFVVFTALPEIVEV
ncbi:MAG: UvrD-helicase domain-containing protein [candidate division WOR-3 bacterium]